MDTWTWAWQYDTDGCDKEVLKSGHPSHKEHRTGRCKDSSKTVKHLSRVDLSKVTLFLSPLSFWVCLLLFWRSVLMFILKVGRLSGFWRLATLRRICSWMKATFNGWLGFCCKGGYCREPSIWDNCMIVPGSKAGKGSPGNGLLNGFGGCWTSLVGRPKSNGDDLVLLLLFKGLLLKRELKSKLARCDASVD